MSKIREELLEATDISQKDNESSQDFGARLMRAVANLDDKIWNKLSDEAVDWYNKSCDEGKALPFPDEKLAKEEAPRRRGRAAESEKEETPASKPYKPAVGDEVTITTNRGKTNTGKIVEIGDESIVIEVAGEGGEVEELEYTRSRLESIVPVKTKEEEPAKSSRRKPADEEQEEPQGAPKLEVGQTVEVTLKRNDKVYSGELLEFDDAEGTLVLAIGDDEREFTRDQLKLLRITKEAPTRSRSKPSADDKPAGKEDHEDGKRSRRSRSDGKPGLGVRVAQLFAEDMKIELPALLKALSKEDYEFKEASVKMRLSDCQVVAAALKEAGKLRA